MATAAVFVEGKGGREVGSSGGNDLSVQERDVPRYKTTNIIAMVLSENDNNLFSFVTTYISLPAYTLFALKSVVTSLPPFHLGWGCQTPQYITRNGGFYFNFHLIINIGINIYIYIINFTIPNWRWIFDFLIFYTIIILERNLSGN